MERQLKLFGIFILILLLTACGGGSEQTPPVVSPPVSDGGGNSGGGGSGGGDGSGGGEKAVVTMTLVRYLSDVAVCADVNTDGVCSSDEMIGVTDETSKIDVDEDLRTHTILAVNPEGLDLLENGRFVFIPKFTLSSVQGFDVISPLSTLSNESGFTPEQIAATWDFPVEHLFGDYNLLNGDNNRNYGYAVAALNKFVFGLIGDEIDISDFVERIARVTPAIKSAMADGESLQDLAISLDPTGLVVTNLESDFVELVTTQFMRQNWNFYQFGNTPQYSQPPQSYGKITIDSLGDMCFNTAELNSRTPFKSDRIPQCRFNEVVDNQVQIGLGSTLLRLQFVFGETTDKGTVLIFQSKNSDNEQTGYYWFDNFESDSFAGEVFLEQDWTDSAYYNVGAELGEYQLYKSQFFFTGKYVITDADNIEHSVESAFMSAYVFDNGLALNGDILTYDNAQGDSFNKTVFRTSDNISLMVVDGAVRSFGVLSKNPDIATSIALGEMYTE